MLSPANLEHSYRTASLISTRPSTTPLGQKLDSKPTAPPQTPAASFKRLYRNCPGPNIRARPSFVCRGTSDRVLTFLGSVVSFQVAGIPELSVTQCAE